MAQLNETFDPNEVPEDDRNFDPLPAGDYDLQVIESEIKETKDGSGEYLKLTMEVISGPHTNRRLWDNLNIRNPNADAQRIAQRALADLCLATGVSQLRDSEELHFKPFVGRVSIRQDKSGQYGPQNSVRYRAKGGQPPAQKAQPVSDPSTARKTRDQGTAATRPAGNGSRPWANRATA